MTTENKKEAVATGVSSNGQERKKTLETGAIVPDSGNSVKITIVTSVSPLTKQFTCNCGYLEKKSLASFYQGNAQIVEAPDMVALNNLFEQMSSQPGVGYHWAAITGRHAEKVYGNPAIVKTEKEIRGLEIARTKDFFDWRDDVVWLCLDVDREVSFADVRQDLIEAVPDLERVGMLQRSSAGSMIFDKASGKWVRGLTGSHTWIRIKRDLIQPLKDLLDIRLWALGHGWIMVSKAGRPLKKCLVDLVAIGPERLVLEAPALCYGGLEQRRIVEITDGGILEHLPDIDDQDLLLARSKKRDAEKAVAPQVTLAKTLYLQGLTRTYGDRAGAIMASRDKGFIKGLDRITFACINGGPNVEVEAWELVVWPERWDGKTCLDPVEPDYDGGRMVGIFYGNQSDIPGMSSCPTVFSQAHGGQKYYVLLDADGWEGVKDALTAGKIKMRGFIDKWESWAGWTVFSRPDIELAQVTEALKRDIKDLLEVEVKIGAIRKAFTGGPSVIGKAQGASGDFVTQLDRAYEEAMRDAGTVSSGNLGDSLYVDILIAGGVGQNWVYQESIGQMVRYTGTHWEVVSRRHWEREINKMMAVILMKEQGNAAQAGKAAPSHSYRKRVSVAQMTAMDYRLTIGEQSQMEKDGKYYKGRMIAFRNGVLDVESRELLPHSRERFIMGSLPFDWSDEMGNPYFERLMAGLASPGSDGDRVLRACLRATLLGRCELQILPYLVGGAGSGKSTLCKVIKTLLGKGLHTNIDLNTFDKHTSVRLPGKRAVFVNELQGYIQGTRVVFIKQYSGGDEYVIRPMYNDEDLSAEPDGIMWLVGNDEEDLAVFKDGSGALLDRLRVIRTPGRPSNVDEYLLDKMIADGMHKVVNELLYGMSEAEMAEVGRGKGMMDDKRWYLMKTDRVSEFLGDTYCFSPGMSVPVGSMRDTGIAIPNSVFGQYSSWCDDKGIATDKRIKKPETFRRAIKKVIAWVIPGGRLVVPGAGQKSVLQNVDTVENVYQSLI